jgi:ACT domain-containing protein
MVEPVVGMRQQAFQHILEIGQKLALENHANVTQSQPLCCARVSIADVIEERLMSVTCSSCS